MKLETKTNKQKACQVRSQLRPLFRLFHSPGRRFPLSPNPTCLSRCSLLTTHVHARAHTHTHTHTHIYTHAQTHFSIVHWSQVLWRASTTSYTHLSSYACRAQVLRLQRPEFNPWLLHRSLPPHLQDYSTHCRVSASGWGGTRHAGGTL